jgi:hypothetical protein
MYDDPTVPPTPNDPLLATYTALTVLTLTTELLHRQVRSGELDPVSLEAAVQRLQGAVARTTRCVMALAAPIDPPTAAEPATTLNPVPRLDRVTYRSATALVAMFVPNDSSA